MANFCARISFDNQYEYRVDLLSGPNGLILDMRTDGEVKSEFDRMKRELDEIERKIKIEIQKRNSEISKLADPIIIKSWNYGIL